MRQVQTWTGNVIEIFDSRIFDSTRLPKSSHPISAHTLLHLLLFILVASFLVPQGLSRASMTLPFTADNGGVLNKQTGVGGATVLWSGLIFSS